ncbi:uncharacterized protein LOC142742572 [Rhinoderma darwinii]|uniref:uncharacterized protein LOC142742572 n=1 Tax=Rhinoderma darwinii TaxID=43563 RepID=UPI003F679627
MALTKPQVESLILFVQDYPVIWDKHREEYKDTVAKEKAWKEVVKSLHQEKWESATVKERRNLVANAKSRWGTCRDQFRREMVSKGRRGEGQMTKKPYVYTQQLQFLKAVMDIGPTSDNHQEVDSDATLVESPSGTTNPPLEKGTPVRRRKRNRQVEERLSSIDAQVLAHLQQRAEDSLEDVFGKTVAQHLKKMPSERQLRCQLAILGVIDTFMNNPAPMELCNAIELHRSRHDMQFSPITAPPPPPPCASTYRGNVPSSQPQFSQDRPKFSAPCQYPGDQYAYPQVQGGELQGANVAGPSNE